MAQRTIHLLFSELLIRGIPVADRPRFLLGSILPDAYEDRIRRRDTHYLRHTGDRTGIYFDFRQFSTDFAPKMGDPLYQGYYLHLFEDVLYRNFLHSRYNFWEQIQNMEHVGRLHRDYHLLNHYIVTTWHMENVVSLPPDFDREPVNRIAPLALPRFLDELAGDFTENPPGKTTMLTEAMLHAFLEACVPLGLAELQKVLEGRFDTDPLAYAWPRRTDDPLLA